MWWLNWFSFMLSTLLYWWISKRVFQENKARQIFQKTNISYSLIRTSFGDKKYRFSKNLPCFVFLKHPFWGSPLCPITDDVHFMKRKLNSWDYLNLSFNITIKLKCLDLHLFHIFLLGLINVTRAYVIHLVFFLGNSSCCSNFL